MKRPTESFPLFIVIRVEGRPNHNIIVAFRYTETLQGITGITTKNVSKTRSIETTPY